MTFQVIKLFKDLITIQISAKLEIVQFSYMYTLNINFNDYRKILSLFLMSNYNRIYLSMIRLWTTKTFFFHVFQSLFLTAMYSAHIPKRSLSKEKKYKIK